jgi:CDP-diacylglycerol---glycerol-3-phosphate 3-phosphatidyltransferase
VAPRGRPVKVGASHRRLTVANAVTALRVVLVPVVAFLLARGTPSAQWWALVVFAVAAFTDTLDGFVARREAGGVTRWGQLADPLADKLLILGCLFVLAWQNQTPWWAVVVIAIREVGITVQRWVLSRRGIVMPADRFGKLKTVTQMAYVAVELAPGTPEVVADILLWAAVLLTVGSGLAYARRGLGRR